jgi:hypothetical protein
MRSVNGAFLHVKVSIARAVIVSGLALVVMV